MGMTNRRRLDARDAHRMLDDPDDLVTLDEAARVLGVPYSTVHKWVSRGRLGYTKVERRVMVSLAEAGAVERAARLDVDTRKGMPRGGRKRRRDTPRRADI